MLINLILGIDGTVDNLVDLEIDETSILVPANPQTRPIIRSSIMKVVQTIVNKLYYSKIETQENPIEYQEIVRSTKTYSTQDFYALHSCLKEAFQMDGALFLALCQDISIDEYLTVDNSSDLRSNFVR